MSRFLKPGTLANRVAKALALALALSILAIIVYCADKEVRDNQPEPDNTTENNPPKDVFIPSSKSGNPTLPIRPKTDEKKKQEQTQSR